MKVSNIVALTTKIEQDLNENQESTEQFEFLSESEFRKKS